MNTREATESRMTAGSETETVGVTGKSKETAVSEVETVVGTESGADSEVGMVSESTADWSGVVVGAKASMRCAIATGGGDAGADLRLTVAGTATGDKAVAVVKVQVCPIAQTIPLACAVVSEFAAPANVWLGSTGTEMEWVG